MAIILSALMSRASCDRMDQLAGGAQLIIDLMNWTQQKHIIFIVYYSCLTSQTSSAGCYNYFTKINQKSTLCDGWCL